MKIMLSLIGVLLLISCAERHGGPAPAPRADAAKQEKSHPAKTRAENFDEIKKIISRNLTSAEKARIAFSSHGDEISRKIADKLVSLFPNSFSLELVGLGNLPPEEALSQLDPRTTPSLVHIHYRNEGDLAVSLFAADGSFSRDLFFDYRYSDAPAPVNAAATRLSRIAMKPLAAICDRTGNIYLLDGEKVVITGQDPAKEILRRPSSCPEPLFFFADGFVSTFCASSEKGTSFAAKGNLFEEKEIASFPLPSRAERFISAGRDENGTLAIFDKEDNILGTFTELCVFKNKETTVFAGLSPDGDIWGLRGDLISVIPSTLKGPYTRLSAAGQSFFALRADGTVEQVALDGKFEWSVSGIDTKINDRPSAIAFCAGRLLLFCPDENGSAVYSIDLPSFRTGGE